MRLPEAKIKQAILHPEEEVRLTAVGYFADSRSADPKIMPLVIQAVETYGRKSAFRILRDAEHVLQTASTLDWLINEFRRDFDGTRTDDNNLRFALALVVVAAPVDLLTAKLVDIDALSNFPDELRGPLYERLQMATWTWEQSWDALLDFGRRTMKKREVTSSEIRYLGRLIESLARHTDDSGTVVSVLQKLDVGTDDRLLGWLQAEIFRLAGEMRLKEAISILVGHVGSDDLNLSDSACTALMRIGTDAVVEAITDEWWERDDEFRGGAVDVLGTIHTDLCAQTCLEFLETEEDLDTALALGNALLSQFATGAVEPVKELVVGDDDDLTPEHFDLRYHLVATATIMEVTFPEYDAWYQDALESNWGWGDHRHGSLADAFRPKPVGSKVPRESVKRLPAEKVKEKLLHHDHEIREAALFYFARCRSPDNSIMPLVIQAIEKYGLDAFPILSASSNVQALADIAQTDETVSWLIREIERARACTDQREVNYGQSLAKGLRHANFALLKRQESAIQEMKGLDDESKAIIADRLSVSSMTPDVLWRELIDFCDSEPDPEAVSDRDFEHVGSVVETLSRYPDQVAERILSTLADEDLDNEWLEGLMIRLAGMARLEAAIPLLVDRFDECGEWVCEEATEALTRIGSDAVVQEIAERYFDSEWPFRIAASSILEDIHTDLSAQTCLELFDQEDDLELQFHLLESTLMNFSPDGIEPARQYILETLKSPDVLEVRSALLVACKVMGKTFPEFEEWLEDSKNDPEFRKKWYEEHPLVMDDEEGFYDEEYQDGDFESDQDETEDEQAPITYVRRGDRIGRNDPCPCGSGKKYKNCCLGKESFDETDEGHSAAMADVPRVKTGQRFPIGTVAFYGPDDTTTTKIVAGVFKREGAEAIIERWVGGNVKENPKVQRKITELFERHGVKSVVATDGNIGCPHEEGLDFPKGEDCPFCPFWAGKQGSNQR